MKKELFMVICCISIAGCNKDLATTTSGGISTTAIVSQSQEIPKKIDIVDLSSDAAVHLCAYDIANKHSDYDVRAALKPVADEKLKLVRASAATKGLTSNVAGTANVVAEQAALAVTTQSALAKADGMASDARAKLLLDLCSKEISGDSKYSDLIKMNL